MGLHQVEPGLTRPVSVAARLNAERKAVACTRSATRAGVSSLPPSPLRRHLLLPGPRNLCAQRAVRRLRLVLDLYAAADELALLLHDIAAVPIDADHQHILEVDPQECPAAGVGTRSLALDQRRRGE